MTEQIMKCLKEILTNSDWEYDENIPEIARSVFTALIVVNKVEPDSALADEWLTEIYKNAILNCRLSFHDFENFMYKYLV